MIWESIFGCYDMTIPVTEDITLYAVYTIDYTIDLNGGTIKEGTAYETELQLIDAVGEFYKADINSINITAPVVYSEDDSTPAKYLVEDFQNNDNIEPPVGYELEAFYTYWNNPAPTYYLKEIDEIVIYAKKKYNVTFQDKGGTVVPTQQVEHGNNVVRPDNPSKDNRYFSYWYIGDNSSVPYDFDTPVTENIELIPLYYMTFVFDLNGGTYKDGITEPLSLNGEDLTTSTITQEYLDNIFND